ncbi:DNA primase [Marinicella sediminis]|uniref:DNA primase n=1 Tax=Marinicella sediminis TaxID=1792834 RepID=A0ABV7JCP4_9GAMM|nr:DNA primase [Marinicella sediminis]
MASIPNDFIDNLLDRIDIVDVVGARVSLKKAGKDYSGLCPFHSENTPSFTVSQQKQFYHCFGCGKNGSAIGFLMEFEGLDFVDAVKDLASLAGVDVPQVAGSAPQKARQNLYAVTEKATRVFQHQLKAAENVIEYLKNRGISGDICQRFQLGYARNEWDGLMKRFPQNEHELLKKTGLTTANDRGRIYDKFRNRLMFPIHDKRGRVIAFGGRAIEADQKPKYLNSPETDLFHKSHELYGLHLARKHSQDDHILVVEGYMDVIALHQHGIANAVATLGTATSSHHIAQLFKIWDRIVFCFDGDNAGRQAAEKALMTALPLYLDHTIIEFLFLPSGEDPDTYVMNQGAESFKNLVTQATPLSEFLLQVISKGINTRSLDGKAQLYDKARPVIDQLPKGTFKSMMEQRIAEQSGVPLRGKKPPAVSPQKQQFLNDNPNRKMISLLLNNPALCEKIPDDLNLHILSFKGVEIIDRIVEIHRANPHIKSAAMLEHFRHTDYNQFLGFLMNMYDHLNAEQQNLEFEDLMNFLNKQINQVKIARLREKQLQEGLSSEEKQALVQLLHQRNE